MHDKQKMREGRSRFGSLSAESMDNVERNGGAPRCNFRECIILSFRSLRIFIQRERDEIRPVSSSHLIFDVEVLSLGSVDGGDPPGGVPRLSVTTRLSVGVAADFNNSSA